MLSSFLYTMLKPSKTTSSNKLFNYDCVTLYIKEFNNVTVAISKPNTDLFVYEMFSIFSLSNTGLLNCTKVVERTGMVAADKSRRRTGGRTDSNLIFANKNYQNFLKLSCHVSLGQFCPK